MAEVVERLVATLEADIRGFTKNMRQAQVEFDQRAAQIERRQTSMVGRMNTGFGRLNMQGLINRYASWSFAMIAAQRIVQRSIEVNNEAAAAWERLDKTLDDLANKSGPGVASFFDAVNETIKRDIRDLEKLAALYEQIRVAAGGTPSARTSGIPFASAATPYAGFDKKSGNWTPSALGFPTPGVTDVTPSKTTTKADDGNNFDRMYNESMNQLAGQLYDQFQRDRETAARESADIFLEGQRIRSESGVNRLTGFTTQEQEALDQFHAEALEAWDQYYEGVADLADQAATLEQERVADRIAEIGSAFEYLGHAALQGGEAFERALANMAASLALSGLRNILEAGLTSIVGGGGFFGNLISGARAGGGPVSGGQTYLVGEKGPELFTPGSSGMIIPNAAMSSGGGSMVLNMPIDARGAQAGVAEQIARVAPAIVAAAVRESGRQFKGNLIKTQRNQM